MAPLSAVAAPQLVRFPAAILQRSPTIPVWNHNYGNRRAIGEPWPLRVASRDWSHAGMVASHLCEREALTLDLDWKEIDVREASSEEELLAAIQLRIRTFYEFKQFYGVEDYTRHLMEREFEALKDRVYGKREEFKRVCCINASLPMSPSLSDASDLCSTCKFSKDGKDRVVVGTLDVNQCLKLADELTGMKPEGSGDNLTRAYLSNVCVASELHRNGLGYTIVAKAKKIALEWGITDLYVHVAADNEAAQKLYGKSGFIYENEEPAWQARFLGRPRRFLLWTDLTQTNL